MKTILTNHKLFKYTFAIFLISAFLTTGFTLAIEDISVKITKKYLNKQDMLLGSEEGSWDIFDKNTSIMTDDNITALSSGKDGIVLIGTNQGGFACLDKDIMNMYNTSSDIYFNDVGAVFADSNNGKFWIGSSISSNGLITFDGKNWKKELHDYNINAIEASTGGKFWIGTDNGLVKIDGPRRTTFTKQNSDIQDNFITSISSQSDNLIWIGTRNGLSRYYNSKWTNYNTSNSGLPAKEITTVVIDQGGFVWIGTNKGFCSFDGEQWTTYDFGDELMNKITALVIDSNGDIWIGTQAGVCQYNSERSIWYSNQNTLIPADKITSIAIDPSGNTRWFGTENGLVRFKNNSTSVNEITNSENDILIYPVPALDYLFIKSDILTQQNSSVRIYNQLGNIVFEDDLSQQIDVSTLPAGNYNLSVFVGDKSIFKKFTIVK